MLQKAHFFGDTDAAQQMKMEDDPVKLKRLGKNIKNFNSSAWKAQIDRVLVEGLHAKFSQDDNLRNFLKMTGSNTLVEANPNDNIFSVGLSLYNNEIWDKTKWRGENRLGRALMQVRQGLI